MLSRFFMSLRPIILGAFFLQITLAAQAEDLVETKVVVKAPANFRDINLHSWRGLARLGVPDSKGLAGPLYGQDLRVALQKNRPLAEKLGKSQENHNYSLGLLAALDYMRANADCFTNMNKYKARTEHCGDTIIQHERQQQPWKDYIRNMALSLTPGAHGTLFCARFDNKSCTATNIDQVSAKGPNGRPRPLDEFQRREFFSKLMAQYQGGFEKLWRNSHFPQEAWFVQVVRLSEYDFDKQHFVFSVSPAVSIINRQFPLPQTRPSKKSGVSMTSRMFALTPKYTPTENFEKNPAFTIAGGRLQVTLPMKPDQAHKLAQSSKGRAFFAVTKIRFLPRKKIDTWGPTAASRQLAFHYAANKVELYRDSALTQKVVELPLVEIVAAADDENKTQKKWQWAQDHHIFDGRAFALMRIKKADLFDEKLQRLADSVAQNERAIWRNYARRLKEMNKPAMSAASEAAQQAQTNRKKRAEDRAKLSHLNWQQMNSRQKNALYQYMLARGDRPDEWPKSFPGVPWGINAATIFRKGYFSDDPALAQIPATDQDKAILQKFLKEIAQSYPTDKLTLVYGLRDTQYDHQSKSLKFKWPFHIRSYMTFDDDKSQKFTTSAAPLINARAKTRAIYPFSPSTAPLGSHIPDPRVSSCKINKKRQSEDCVTGYNHFLQINWPGASLAFDRVLTRPDMKMDPVRAIRLLNSQTRGGAGWRLVVELDEVDMTLSPFMYKPNYKKEMAKGEAQTIFANVKKAYILAPNDEMIWQAGRNELVPPVDRSRLAASSDTAFTWPSSVSLFENGRMDHAVYDFLFAREYPDRLDQRFLEAMFSSRWGYEKSAKAPTGGRFFNTDARRPTWQDVQKSLPEFKQWLIRQAGDMPARLKIDVPLYYANNTVAAQNQCVSLKLTANSPLRNSGSARAVADSKIRACKTAENQKKYQFQQCNSLRNDLSRAKAALAKSQKAGCKTTAEDIPEETVNIDAGGSCNFSNVDFRKLQGAMMACMTDRCGPTPTTMGGMTDYQKCVKAVSAEMQDQMRLAMGGGKRKPKSQPRPKILDNCKPHQQVIRSTERRLKSDRCETLTLAPEPVNCSILGEIPAVTHMHVERLLLEKNSFCGDPSYLRKSNSSASLLPYARPYSDTSLQLEIAVGLLKVPYDPPYETTTPANAILELELDIQSAGTGNRKNVMKLRSVVKSSTIKAAK